MHLSFEAIAISSVKRRSIELLFVVDASINTIVQ
jgi:hypothetical protein